MDSVLAMCEGGHHVVAVGDVVSAELWKHRFDGLNMRLYIFDGKTERHETTEFMDIINEKAFGPVIHACNPPGSITDELVAAVKDGLRGVSRYIHVDGEEDLALIPVIRYATEGTIVVYGWPGEGMMAVRVDESLRSQMVRLWQEMEQVGHDREEF